MCRSLRILCAARDPGSLAALRRAVVSSSWELVGGATTLEELLEEARRWEPDVVVIDATGGGAALFGRAAAGLRATVDRVRVLSVGSLPGAEAAAGSLEDVRPAIVGLGGPGGPVRS